MMRDRERENSLKIMHRLARRSSLKKLCIQIQMIHSLVVNQCKLSYVLQIVLFMWCQVFDEAFPLLVTAVNIFAKYIS